MAYPLRRDHALVDGPGGREPGATKVSGDPRYQAGIIQGIKLNGGHLGLFYLNQPSPWPGRPVLGAFSPCSICLEAWSFVSYEGRATCLDCARRKEIDA